jgi:hypothetical protein
MVTQGPLDSSHNPGSMRRRRRAFAGATVAGVACLLLAGLALPRAAGAAASVDVIWTATEPSYPPLGGIGTRVLQASPGDEAYADVLVTVGNEGLSFAGLSLEFDTDLADELDLLGVEVLPAPSPPGWLVVSSGTTNESSASEVGYVEGFSAGCLPPCTGALFNTTLVLARIRFRITQNVASDGDDVFPLIVSGVDFLADAMNEEITPSLANARVDRPPSHAWAFRTVASTGAPVPGGSGVFSFLGRRPFLHSEVLGFSASGSDGEGGIYAFVGNKLEALVDQQTLVPGSNEAFASFGAFDFEAGRLSFQGVDPNGFEGIYEADIDAGTVTAIAQQGDTAIPGGTGTFTQLLGVGRDAFDTAFLGRGGGGQEGIYRFTPDGGGALDVVADRSTPIPGEGGTPFDAFAGVSPTFDAGEIAFIASDNEVLSGIYRDDGSSLTKVVDTNTPVPDVAGNFIGFESPALDAQRVAFRAIIPGGEGIYVSDPLEKIADTKTPIPDGSGSFSGFGNVALRGQRVAFVGIGSKAIYTTLDGGLERMIAVGDPLDGRVVADLDLGEGAIEGRQIVFWAAFENGSEGIFTASVPPPVPALSRRGLAALGLALLTLGVAAALGHARPGRGVGV